MGISTMTDELNYFSNLVISDTSEQFDLSIEVEASTGYVSSTFSLGVSVVRAYNQPPLFIGDYELTLEFDLT